MPCDSRPRILRGGEVGDDGDGAADEFFGLVPLGDAGKDLALFVTEIDFEAEELVGFGDALGDEDAGDAEVDLDEVVDGDLGCGFGHGRSGGGVGEGRRGRRFVVGWGTGPLGGEGGRGGDVGAGVLSREGRGARGGGGMVRGEEFRQRWATLRL